MSQATRRQQQFSPCSDERSGSRRTHRRRNTAVIGILALACACFFAVVLSGSSRQTPATHANLSVPDTQSFHSAQSRRFRIVPEYERHMERVVMSISDSDAVPKYHDEILSSLPDYAN